MFIKVTQASLQMDAKAKTWLFLAQGRDGSVYSYDTHSSINKKDRSFMYKRLKELVFDGFINANHWRLV